VGNATDRSGSNQASRIRVGENPDYHGCVGESRLGEHTFLCGEVAVRKEIGAIGHGRAKGTYAATAALLVGVFSLTSSAWAASAERATATAALPDAPQAATSQAAAAQNAPSPAGSAPAPCPVKRPASGAEANAAKPAAPDSTAPVGNQAAGSATPAGVAVVPCPLESSLITSLPIIKKLPLINWYARFLDGPQVKPMTPKEKAWLAVRDVADPFNGITILGSSAIAVAANSHSAYGPGMTGWGKYVGVSYSQDMTGEFFGTFLIPSIAHQDPHYHRMPTASIKRRIAHVMYQVFWTQGDNGRGMLNYADLVGFGIDDEIGNLYVPGQETNLGASAKRYGIGLATAPIGNAVAEFLPDVARHIHVQIVIIQQIINQVAQTGKPTGP
jgi:hypothetical protein